MRQVVIDRAALLSPIINDYYKRYGIAKHFMPDGIYADVDWHHALLQQLEKLPDEVLAIKDSASYEATDVKAVAGVNAALFAYLFSQDSTILSAYAQGQTLPTDSEESGQLEAIYPRVFTDLLQELALPKMNQSQLIKQYLQYQKTFTDCDLNEIDEDGICFGLACAKIIGHLLPTLALDPDRLSIAERERFADIDLMIRRINSWDNHADTVDDTLRQDMQFISTFVLPLQDEQTSLQAMLNTLLGDDIIDNKQHFSWVFQGRQSIQHSVDFLQERNAQVILSADRHAAAISISTEGVTYYNANSPHATVTLPLNDDFINKLCSGIRNGFSNTHIDRMPLSFTLLGKYPQAKLNIESMIDQLVAIQIRRKYPDIINIDHVQHAHLIREAVSMPGADGKTALMLAAKQNNHEEVRLLLQRGANVNSRDVHGFDAIHLAMYADAFECIDLLLAREELRLNDLNEGCAPLHVACRQITDEHLQLLQRLLADPRIQANITCRTESGYQLTPLQYAIEYGNHKAVELLLQRQDVLVNSPAILADDDPLIATHHAGINALVLAVAEQYDFKMANALLRRGADTTLLNQSDRWWLSHQLLEHGEHSLNDILEEIVSGYLLIDEDDDDCLQLTSLLLEDQALAPQLLRHIKPNQTDLDQAANLNSPTPTQSTDNHSEISTVVNSQQVRLFRPSNSRQTTMTSNVSLASKFLLMTAAGSLLANLPTLLNMMMFVGDNQATCAANHTLNF